MRVAVPGLRDIDPDTAHNAVLVILDTGIGERSAALDVQHVEVCEVPGDPEGEEFIQLPELPAYISWRKRRVNNPS